MTLKSFLLFMLFVTSCFQFAQAQAQTEKRPIVQMTATEWPPFSSENLPGQGISIEIIRDTLDRAGFDLEVIFAPWTRSLANILDDRDLMATGPVYHSDAREKFCYFSDPFGESRVGFVQRKDTPVVWKSLDDLTGVSIGTVMGYTNSKEFDRLANDQVLDVSAVPNDMLNLRRIAFGRVDLAVIDEMNMKYLMASDPRLKPYRDILEMNERLLVTHDTLLCFKRSNAGKRLRNIFNAHLDRERADAIAHSLMERIAVPD